jgi:hypothetical protein
MRRRFRWTIRFGLAGAAGVLAFAALASVGAAVSPSGTPAASEQYPKKVVICHKTGSKKNPFRTIRVSRNAVKAHLRHGDRVGPCSTAMFTVCHKSKGNAKHTTRIKGAKAAARHLRHGDRLGKCKKPKQAKPTERGKGSEKPKKEKGKPADRPGRGGEKGKPADTPGNGGEKGKKK